MTISCKRAPQAPGRASIGAGKGAPESAPGRLPRSRRRQPAAPPAGRQALVVLDPVGLLLGVPEPPRDVRHARVVVCLLPVALENLGDQLARQRAHGVGGGDAVLALPD